MTDQELKEYQEKVDGSLLIIANELLRIREWEEATTLAVKQLQVVVERMYGD